MGERPAGRIARLIITMIINRSRITRWDFFARQGEIRREFTLRRDSEGIKGARVQYALSLLSTIKRGGRAELARAEPSGTELQADESLAASRPFVGPGPRSCRERGGRYFGISPSISRSRAAVRETLERHAGEKITLSNERIRTHRD